MSKSYSGIDVHKKWCVFTEIDSTGTVIRQGRFGHTPEEVYTFASSLVRKVRIVLEPVLDYLWLSGSREWAAVSQEQYRGPSQRRARIGDEDNPTKILGSDDPRERRTLLTAAFS